MIHIHTCDCTFMDTKAYINQIRDIDQIITSLNSVIQGINVTSTHIVNNKNSHGVPHHKHPAHSQNNITNLQNELDYLETKAMLLKLQKDIVTHYDRVIRDIITPAKTTDN